MRAVHKHVVADCRLVNSIKCRYVFVLGKIVLRQTGLTVCNTKISELKVLDVFVYSVQKIQNVILNIIL